MLPVPAQGPLVLVDPLGEMLGRNVPFVDDMGSVDGVDKCLQAVRNLLG